ncbi:MAG: hypothetical protein V4603_01870 [Pseudomonadota bacterium]
MKTLALLATLAIAGCSTPHIENTVGQASSALAKVAVVDRQARLIKVDGAAVEAPTIGSYYLKPGSRELEFQLQHGNATAPGKSMGGGITTINRFVTTRVELKAGHEYQLTVEGTRVQPKLVVNERAADAVKVASAD